MPAPLEKTSTPGVFKRGTRYAVLYRDAQGRQRQESARTYDDARRLRRKRMAAVDEGTHAPATRTRFADYAREWVERYQGRGRRGFRERTRDDYRRDLERYAIPRLGSMRMEQITPRDIADLVGWMCDNREQGKRVADEKTRPRGSTPSGRGSRSRNPSSRPPSMSRMRRCAACSRRCAPAWRPRSLRA
ncbi:MAG: phage integrase central domain-containing protein [Solirubrobacteraceae bacterium]